MIRLFHASDLHFGAEDTAALDWFAAAVTAERPDAVIITGDLTMRARSREFAAATAWLLALPAPVTVEIGNHDMPYFNPIERLTAPYKRYGKMEKLVERPIDLPGLSIVPLRTTSRAQLRLNWSDGIVRPRALARTIRTIDAGPRAAVTLIAAHHPLMESLPGGRTLTRGGTAALDALIRAGATAVLSGHVHDPFDLVHHSGAGSIRMIGAGTLSERVRATRPSFNQLSLAGDGTLDVMLRAMA